MLRRALIAICMLSILCGCISGGFLMLHHPGPYVDLSVDFAGVGVVFSGFGFFGSILGLMVLRAFGTAAENGRG
jgi:hypothetical protein